MSLCRMCVCLYVKLFCSCHEKLQQNVFQPQKILQHAEYIEQHDIHILYIGEKERQKKIDWERERERSKEGTRDMCCVCECSIYSVYTRRYQYCGCTNTHTFHISFQDSTILYTYFIYNTCTHTRAQIQARIYSVYERQKEKDRLTRIRRESEIPT